MKEVEARYYTRHLSKSVQCNLCPHHCVLQAEKIGICRARKNQDGKLIASTYGSLSALNLDPIEKKPLYHFHPGKQILSLGSVGCNMQCACCQNYSISQVAVTEMPRLIHEKNEDIIKLAKSYPGNIGLAFTYNEPTVWYEYMFDLAKLAKENDLLCVMVSNGFINKKPLSELLPYIDACNIDIKASTEDAYKEFSGASLKAVQDNLKLIKESGTWLELTYLLVPDVNDKLKEFTDLIKWIDLELGKDTVLHISRYFPTFKMDTPSTPNEVLDSFTEIASKRLNYVYQGNVSERKYSDTLCPECHSKLILRSGYQTQIVNLSKDGKCKSCKRSISIVN